VFVRNFTPVALDSQAMRQLRRRLEGNRGVSSFNPVYLMLTMLPKSRPQR